MALYVEPINHLSITEDPILQRDLDNLYTNLSHNLVTALNDCDDACSAYIAKFNGHALAILVIRANKQSESVFIEHLIVRESTKRRGVGLFLLSEVLNLHSDKMPWSWFLTFSQYQSSSALDKIIDQQTLNVLAETYIVFFAAVKAAYPNLLKTTIAIKS